MKKLPFEGVRKDEQPVIGPGVPGPLHLPVGTLSQKIVFPYVSLERAL
jgi:hypothetical protein